MQLPKTNSLTKFQDQPLYKTRLLITRVVFKVIKQKCKIGVIHRFVLNVNVTPLEIGDKF